MKLDPEEIEKNNMMPMEEFNQQKKDDSESILDHIDIKSKIKKIKKLKIKKKYKYI